MSWNDATKGQIAIRSLPPDSFTYSGLGGIVNAYILQQTTLTFKGSNGRHVIPIGDLSVSDFLNTDGTPCPFMSSMLGMDLLYNADLFLRDTYAILRMPA